MTRKRGKIKSKQRSDSSQKSDDELLYCICRSSDGTRFMIACDNCEEWYHGDCINVTPKQANNIKRFYCHLCIGRNPSLEIEYKTIKESRPRLPNLRQQIKKINFSSDDENDADLSSTSTPDKSFPSGRSKKSSRKRIRNSFSEIVKSPTPNIANTTKKRRGRPRERPDDYDEEATEDEMETAGIAPSLNDCTTIGIVDEPSESMIFNNHNKKPFRRQLHNNYIDKIPSDNRKGCGLCIGCKVVNNCGKCDLCMKFTTTGTMSRLGCRKRICIRNQGSSRSTINQYGKDFSIFEEDFDDVLNDGNFNRSFQNRGVYDVREVRQRLMNPGSNKNSSAAVGSKMRRGDHLPGGGGNSSNRRVSTMGVSGSGSNQNSVNFKYIQDEDGGNLDVTNGNGGIASTTILSGTIPLGTNTTNYRYQNTPSSRLSRNPSNSSVPQRRGRNQSDPNLILSNNTTPPTLGLLPSSQTSHQGNYDESDEDVMLPSDLMSPIRRQMTEVQYQIVNNRDVNIDIHKYEYGLNYPDHLYCKHHRSFNWHNNDVNSTDTLTLRTEPSLKDEKEIETSHNSLSSIDELSPNSTYMILERTVTKSNKLCPSNLHQKTLMKTSSDHDRSSNLSDSGNVYLYTNTNQTAYPIVDLNQHIPHEISLVTSQSQIEQPMPPHSASTSVFSKASVTNAQSQEFYTINDDDSLEINWPKETVNV